LVWFIFSIDFVSQMIRITHDTLFI